MMEPYVVSPNHVEELASLLLAKNFKEAVEIIKQADLTAGNREAR